MLSLGPRLQGGGCVRWSLMPHPLPRGGLHSSATACVELLHVCRCGNVTESRRKGPAWLQSNDSFGLHTGIQAFGANASCVKCRRWVIKRLRHTTCSDGRTKHSCTRHQQLRLYSELLLGVTSCFQVANRAVFGDRTGAYSTTASSATPRNFLRQQTALANMTFLKCNRKSAAALYRVGGTAMQRRF